MTIMILMILGSLGIAALAAWMTYRLGFLAGRDSISHPMHDIMAFHEKFGLDYNGPARVLDPDLVDFRIKFEHEELGEYIEVEQRLRAFINDFSIPWIRKQTKIDQMLELQLDALVDLTYVVLGHAYLQFGPEVFMEAWRRVHEANMKKVRKLQATPGHSDSGRAPKYDVVKPAGWTPPSHIDLIERRHEELLLADRELRDAELMSHI